MSKINKIYGEKKGSQTTEQQKMKVTDQWDSKQIKRTYDFSI